MSYGLKNLQIYAVYRYPPIDFFGKRKQLLCANKRFFHNF